MIDSPLADHFEPLSKGSGFRGQGQNRGPENGKNRDSDFTKNRAKYARRNARIAALNWLH